MNRKAYLFDIDGTLTMSRQKMTTDHAMPFLSWINEKDVFLVTGSDYKKAQEQIPYSIVSRCKGIFTSMGNVYHKNDKVVYENIFTLPSHVKNSLDDILATSKCPAEFKSTTNYEQRPGMINFSICGRDVSKAQRKQYNEWDENNKEREKLVNWFNEAYKKDGLEACLGGEISIDIQPIGKDKRQSVEQLLKEDYDWFVFFGDRAYPGGNDWGVCEYIVSNKVGSYYSVNSPNETVALLSQGI